MRLRLPDPSPANLRRITLANLIANLALVTTGGAVRLTGSGLGCEEWPTCNFGHLVPTPAMGINTYIEFVNRLLTFVLVGIALLTWLVVRRLTPPRPDLARLALLVGLGIPAQGVVGGITVLTGLNPYTVMAHLLITMVLIYWAAVLHHRARAIDRVVPEYPSPAMHWLARVLLAATYLTLALGTFVTGSGPHGGDPDAGRTGFAPALVAQLHADAVFLLVGLSLAVLIIAYVLPSSGLRRAAGILVGIELVQGLIGYVQYFNSLPLLLVGIHLTLAGVTMAAATFTAEELRYVRIGRARTPGDSVGLISAGSGG